MLELFRLRKLGNELKAFCIMRPMNLLGFTSRSGVLWFGYDVSSSPKAWSSAGGTFWEVVETLECRAQLEEVGHLGLAF
jgi:hypothetical protein